MGLPLSLGIRRAPVHPVLADVIANIWIFWSSGGPGDDDMRIVVPNGSAKLLLLFRGGLLGRMDGREFAVPEHRVYMLGAADVPAFADFDLARPFGCICFEFHSAAAYRLLTVPQHELRNEMTPLSDLVGGSAPTALEQRLLVEKTPEAMAAVLQEHVAGKMLRPERDAAFEHCVATIVAARGAVSLRRLSRETAYSERWIRAKFADKLGLNPKTFASVMRFQSGYRSLLQNRHEFRRKRILYELYYDEAHFIKEFQRFTGYSPARYTALQNNVGELIYTQ